MYELCFCSSINVRPNGCLKDNDRFLRKNNFPTSQMFQICRGAWWETVYSKSSGQMWYEFVFIKAAAAHHQVLEPQYF